MKAAAALISIGAAVATILSSAQSYSPEASSARMRLAAASVNWVALTPKADTATALGDTMRFAITVTDKHGAVVAIPVTWTSDDPTVATVDDQGQVLARAPGATTITAAVGSHVARARILVHQAVARAHVVPDSALRLGEGEQRRLEVRATDANGFVVSGRRVEWHVSDTTVAAVDSTGALTARSAGEVSLTASVDGVAARSPVAVVAVPASATLVGDGELRAVAGRALARPVMVHLTSQRNRPAANLLVRFAPLYGHGRVDSDTVRADAGGNAAASWTLGGAPGRQVLRINVEGLDTMLVATAEAEPVAANTRYVTPPGDLAGRVGESLSQPVTVRLTDSLGRALADVPVAWSAEDGGSVEVIDARTDTLGDARARWTLGPKSGKQRLRAQAGSARAIPPFYVTATAAAGAAASATVVSGGGQTARVGGVLAKRVLVRVRDAGGNAVAGARVMAMAAAGSTSDTLLVTDSTGVVSVRWTLGQVAGAQQLHIRPEGVAQALAVTATARPREAANIEFLGAPSNGVAGQALAAQVRVAVTDIYGNAIAEAPVAFTPRAGTITPRQRVTDAAGRATARWVLGRSAGTQTLLATVPRTGARAELTVDVRAEASVPTSTSRRKP